MGYGEFASAAGRWRSHDAPHSPTRDGAGCTLKQHLWGARYVDDLVQIAVNDDPPSQPPLRRAGPRDGNPHASGLVARYDCTPGVHPPRRGQRTVFKKAGSKDALTTAPLVHSQRVETDAGRAPYGLCDVGHQGLMYDEQFGLVYNRNRYLDPRTGRWMQRDSAGYVDGMGLYEYCRSASVVSTDPMGGCSSDRASSYPECGHCCVEDLVFANMPGIVDSPSWVGGKDGYGVRVIGFEFDVVATFKYVKTLTTGFEDCRFEWWEYTSQPVVAMVDSKTDKTLVPAGEWVEVYSRYKQIWPENRMFKPLRDAKVKLGETQKITIHDTPGTKTTKDKTVHTMWWAIRVTSAKKGLSAKGDKRCEHPKKERFAVMRIAFGEKVPHDIYLMPTGNAKGDYDNSWKALDSMPGKGQKVLIGHDYRDPRHSHDGVPIYAVSPGPPSWRSAE